MNRHLLLAAVLGVVLLVLSTVVSIQTGSLNVRATTGVAKVDEPVTANDLKPAECNAILIADIVTDRTNEQLSGTGTNELVLAAQANNNIDGAAGDDCIIVPAGATKAIDGGEGEDICIGVPSTTFQNCETTYVDGIESHPLSQ